MNDYGPPPGFDSWPLPERERYIADLAERHREPNREMSPADFATEEELAEFHDDLNAKSVREWRAERDRKEPLNHPRDRAPPIGETVVPPALDVLDVGDDDQPIPPRQWLLGNAFCREFVSGLIAPGAGAKTSLRIAQALSLASGRSLTGEHVFVRCNVLFVCLEDGMKELRRRVRAAMIHHKVRREDVKGRLFLTTPTRMKMARTRAKGAVVPGDLDAAIRTFVDEKKIDLVILDPIKKAHAVEENDNDDMDAVVTILAGARHRKEHRRRHRVAREEGRHAHGRGRQPGARRRLDEGRRPPHVHEHVDDRGRGEDVRRLR